MKDKEEVLKNCDPGIRSTLRWLWSNGFETSDSGDGVAKLSEEYDVLDLILQPHVAVVPHVLMDTLEQSERLYFLAQQVSDNNVRIEATRSWPERVWTILFLPSVGWISDLNRSFPT